ncbi:hypothetical protein [Nostoc sp. NIES-3756]|nr:hypothetical protein [Nostoc sp. NIES-3756]
MRRCSVPPSSDRPDYIEQQKIIISLPDISYWIEASRICLSSAFLILR